jgi:hypothetical protein
MIILGEATFHFKNQSHLRRRFFFYTNVYESVLGFTLIVVVGLSVSICSKYAIRDCSSIFDFKEPIEAFYD